MPTTYEPSLRDLSALQKLVLSWVSQEGLSDTELNDRATGALNAALGRINGRTWKKIISQADITLTASDEDYTFADASINKYKEPITMMRLDSSSKRDGRLDFLPIQTFYDYYDSATQDGHPRVYTVDPEQRLILLNVAPSSNFVSTYPKLRHVFHRRVAEFSAATDTTDIPPEFDWYLIWAARAEIADGEGDSRKADIALQKAEQLWRELTSDDNDSQTDYFAR